jgi:hypothetical protein
MERAYTTMCRKAPTCPPSGRGHDTGARGMRALIANEPSIYREVISAALKELRPDIEIFISEPDDLEGEFLRILPQLVVCSRPTKLVEREAPAWVELYPGGASHAVVKCLDGSRRTLPTMDFDTLLSILDGI